MFVNGLQNSMEVFNVVADLIGLPVEARKGVKKFSIEMGIDRAPVMVIETL